MTQKQSKNYIGFVNDHSGSMASLATAAKNDYNNTINAVKGAASREMLDTIVSVVAIGIGNGGYGCERQVVISNPHVLKPVTDWPTPGGTPLFDGIGDMIELFESLPDANDPHVSFLVMATTDGEEAHSRKYGRVSLAAKIAKLQATGRWTFVMRVPKGNRHQVNGLNIPLDNIQEWETSTAGMAASTAATTQAMDGYFAARSAGKTSSTVFYANASAVDTSKLADITSKVSLYVVDPHQNGIQIRDFILTKRNKYLKGAAFYQLMKTEPRVQPSKMIAVRDRSTGKFYAGKEARQMLGLSTVNNIRLHPGDHGNFDLFIQSESVNRKLVAGYGVMYWPDIGVEFTEEEINRYTQPATPKAAGPVVLPQVAPTNRPTPSPLKPTPKADAVAPVAPVAVSASNKPMPIKHAGSDGRVRYHIPPVGALFYSTRDIAREVAHSMPGKKQYDAGPTALRGRRFYVA